MSVPSLFTSSAPGVLTKLLSWSPLGSNSPLPQSPTQLLPKIRSAHLHLDFEVPSQPRNMSKKQHKVRDLFLIGLRVAWSLSCFVFFSFLSCILFHYFSLLLSCRMIVYVLSLSYMCDRNICATKNSRREAEIVWHKVGRTKSTLLFFFFFTWSAGLSTTIIWYLALFWN